MKILRKIFFQWAGLQTWIIGCLLMLQAGCPGESVGRAYDAGIQKDKSTSKKDTRVVDLKRIDQKLNEKHMDPCPCKPPLLCVKALCRITCTPLDCNQPSSLCKDDESCVPIQSDAGVAVCLVAQPQNANCSGSNPCQARNLCIAAPGQTAGICKSVCQEGDQCASGGVCTLTPDQKCRYCP